MIDLRWFEGLTIAGLVFAIYIVLADCIHHHRCKRWLDEQRKNDRLGDGRQPGEYTDWAGSDSVGTVKK